jgi:hypothetical protein
VGGASGVFGLFNRTATNSGVFQSESGTMGQAIHGGGPSGFPPAIAMVLC